MPPRCPTYRGLSLNTATSPATIEYAAFSSREYSLGPRSRYYQSLGVIAAAGAVVGLLLLLSWPATACCKRCCCKDGDGEEDEDESLSAPLYAGNGADKQRAVPKTSACCRVVYLLVLALVLAGTTAGVVLTFVGSIEVTRTAVTVANALATVAGVMNSISDCATDVSTEGSELVNTAAALAADAGCQGAPLCAPLIVQFDDLAAVFGPDGDASVALSSIVNLVQTPASYASSAPDTTSTVSLRAVTQP